MRQPPSRTESGNRVRQPVKQREFRKSPPEWPLWKEPAETATPTAEDGEETTGLFEDGELFHEGLQERPEDVDDDEAKDHVQQYMRQLARTPLLTEEGEKEVALRIEEARRELEGIGLSLPFAAEELLAMLSRSEADGGTGGARAIGPKQDQSKETESPEQSDRSGVQLNGLITEMNTGRELAREKIDLPIAELDEVLERIKRAKKQYIEARNVLTKANLRLVVTIARRYINRGLSFPDLVQEGNAGLMKAAEKFDCRMGYRFSTYAVWWIRQAIRRAIKEQTRTIHVPPNMLETVQQVARVSHDLAQSLGREPFPHEIAGEMGLSIKKVREVLHITHEPISLETPVGDEGVLLVDLLEDRNATDPQGPALGHDLAEGLNKALSTLTPREEKLIRMRFGIGEKSQHTLEQLAETLGLTRERVRQIEAKALKKLRHYVKTWED